MNRATVKLRVALIAAGLLVSFFAMGCQQAQSSKKDGYSFSTPRKSPHYESNTPAHATVLAAVPTNVVIDFNFDLGPQSRISIRKGGKEYATGKTTIDKGAKVTWVNEDSVEHFVNTDGHPAHTYFPKQNSRGLKKGATFSVTFNKPGIYPYHCSAHAERMTGAIIVK